MQKGENENKNETEKHDWYTEAKGSSKYLMIKHIFPENVFFLFLQAAEFYNSPRPFVATEQNNFVARIQIDFFSWNFFFFFNKKFLFLQWTQVSMTDFCTNKKKMISCWSKKFNVSFAIINL